MPEQDPAPIEPSTGATGGSSDASGSVSPGASSAGPKRAAVIFVFITIVLDMLALGMIVPVLPKLVVQFLGGNTASAAEVYGLFGTAWALMQFVFAPLLGVMSDRFGRRPIILLSNFGLGLDYVLMALAPSLGWLFLGRVIAGITSASVPAASAYIADVTPAEKRASAFGLIGAAFGIGFSLGPAVGGLLGSIDPRLPFWAAAALSLTNAMYGTFVLPESLPVERRRPFSWKRANPVGSLRLFRSHPELFGLATVLLLSALAHEVLPSTFVLYADYRYRWDTGTVGMVFAVVGICSGIVQGLLMRRAIATMGERRTQSVGLIFGALGFAVFGFASTGMRFMIGIPLMALWGLAGPAAQGLMSRRVEPTEQGQLQGAIASIRGICGLIGPALFTNALAQSIKPGAAFHLPGAPFLLAAALLAVAVMLAYRVTRASRQLAS